MAIDERSERGEADQDALLESAATFQLGGTLRAPAESAGRRMQARQ
jgi:hypothetical protein